MWIFTAAEPRRGLIPPFDGCEEGKICEELGKPGVLSFAQRGDFPTGAGAHRERQDGNYTSQIRALDVRHC